MRYFEDQNQMHNDMTNGQGRDEEMSQSQCSNFLVIPTTAVERL